VPVEVLEGRNHRRSINCPAEPRTVVLYLTSLAKPPEGVKPRKAASSTKGQRFAKVE
jgi:hypothetical protein